MPKGPKGERRPATGEITEKAVLKSAAAKLGSKGGKARAASLSKKKRAEIAKKAAAKRWGIARD
jgi:hypothetical protein